VRAGWKLLGLAVGVAAAAGVGIVLGRSASPVSNNQNALAPTTSESVAGVGVGTSPGSSPAASWSLDHLTDGMTDDQIVRARRIFSGQAFMVRTDVECVGGRRLRYRFEVLRADRRHASLRGALFRADDGPIHRWSASPFDSTNAVEISAEISPSSLQAVQQNFGHVSSSGLILTFADERPTGLILFAVSNRLRVTFQTTNGEAFVDFQQGSAPLRTVMGACGIDANAFRQGIVARSSRAEPPQPAVSTQPYESEQTRPAAPSESEEGAPDATAESQPGKRGIAGFS